MEKKTKKNSNFFKKIFEDWKSVRMSQKCNGDNSSDRKTAAFRWVWRDILNQGIWDYFIASIRIQKVAGES